MLSRKKASWTRLSVALLLVGLVLAGSVAVGVGCRPSAGDGSSGGFALSTGQPGEGLPTTLPSGLLVLAVRTDFNPPDGSMLSFRDVISTLDADGQNLTGRFALSLDDKVWRLSPDGIKVATYREVYDEATDSFTNSYYVYDLATGAVTALGMPPVVWGLGNNGGVGRDRIFCWSEDSRSVLYTYMADANRIDGYNNVMVSLTIAPADGSAPTFKDIGYGERVFAQIPGQPEIIFAGPNSGRTASDSDMQGDATLEIFNLETGEERSAASTANQPLAVTVSRDGRFAACECLDDNTDGANPALIHTDLSLVDLGSGTASAVDDHTDSPTSIFDRTCWWSPAADILAVIVRNNAADGGTVSSIYLYDATQNLKIAEAKDISEQSLHGATWSGDGTAFYATFDTTVYKVDPATGEFSPFYTSDAAKSGLGVTP